MIHLDLPTSDAEILIAVLDGTVADLSYEIANTDLLDYREMLKQKRTVLQKVVLSLREGGNNAH